MSATQFVMGGVTYQPLRVQSTILTTSQLIQEYIKSDNEFCLAFLTHQVSGLRDEFRKYGLSEELPSKLPSKFYVQYESELSLLEIDDIQTIHRLPHDLAYTMLEKLYTTLNFELQELLLMVEAPKPTNSDGQLSNLTYKDITEHVFNACSSGNIQRLSFLLDKFGDDIVDLKNNTAFTPLHHACFTGQLGICRMLLDHGAEVEATAKLNMTAIHVAATAGHTKIVELLLEYGADPFHHDMLGNTALDKAKMGNFDDIVNVISSIEATY
jgi:ankyrin repeat protein